MKLTFDYYHNLEQVDLFLCNPDGRELFPLPGKSRNLTLRFNDLSELTFEVDSKITLSNNTVVDLEAYDYIQTKRLVYATNIGWFQISGVDEHDNGVVKYKTVKAESYQSVLKNKGFISEERVYCFYNPDDPHDDRYDSTKEDSIPSVLGQWSKQLGIKQALGQGLSEPTTPYDDWTVTYIHSSLIYAGAGSMCRTFKESVTYGYDWMVNDVEEAFEVVILFDFMYKTIHVMTPNEVTQRVNVIYTFNNFMKRVEINEASEDIVTVLNCNGNNCDITAVNPTGTNYICDFSYYMDKTNYRWMSSALITKLEQWKAACDAEKDTYTDYVSQLRSLWLQKTQCMTSLQEMSLSLQDLKNAQNKRSVVGNGTPGALCGIVAAESVQSGKKSIKSGTTYYSTAFIGSKTITAYQFAPSYNATTRKWVFSGAYKTGTADSIVASNLSDSNTSGVSYWYFSDVSDGSSYCKLQSAVTVNKDSATSTYYCGGFDRYIAYSYPIVGKGTGVTTYTDSVQEWINLRESLVTSLNVDLYGYGYETENPTSESISGQIKSVTAALDSISSRLNILSYFASTPALLRELNCYWIEGDYTNDNIAVLEETTPEEEIDLANELLDAGYIELSKVCQPRFSFSLESRDATKQYEFKDQMRLLELGKIITIEKEEGLWYYPALLEISLNLDNSEEFSMTFANAMRLDDWGYTYADLISDASSTSRKVSANWQDILAYSKERAEISSLIKDPLDTTLRASFANMVNQEFTVDKNGILGRKRVSETSDEFEPEQVRLINNLLLFTDDNWETAKTALGKIYYTDNDGNQITSYGLIAETIIGSLIMSERLKIQNAQSTVEIGAEGITIKKEDGSVVFTAKPDGSVSISSEAITDNVRQALDVYVSAGGLDAVLADYTKNDDLLHKLESYVTASGLETKLTDYATNGSVNSKLESYVTSSSLTTTLSSYTTNNELTSKLESYVTSEVLSIALSSYTTNGQLTDTLQQYVTASSLGTTLSSYTTDGKLTNTLNSYVTSTAASATYAKITAGSTSTFGYTLNASGFTLSSNGSTVMKVTSSGLEVTGKITASSGSLGNLTVTGRLTFGGDNSYYIDANYNDSYYYVKLPGLRIDEANGAVFSGKLSAATGTFGTSTYPFNISTSSDSTDSPCIYSRGGTFPGMGGVGVVADNYVYIGGDGFSYWNGLPETSDYLTGIRPGVIVCAGDTNGKQAQNKATILGMGELIFSYGGTDNLRTNYIRNYKKGAMQVRSTDVLLTGTFTGETSGSIVSDRNKKNTINPFSNEYDIFFDALQPITYKYNYGSSGRLHSGFIAQDVLSALTAANLATQQLAAYVEAVDLDDSIVCGLRYEEFIALNTWQIQKLKVRVAELEAVVAKLQEG